MRMLAGGVVLFAAGGVFGQQERFDADRAHFAGKPVVSYSATPGVELTWGQVPVADFGSRPISFDMTGVRTLNPAPAPGVHPRILCTPTDRDDIALRLRETRCGQEVWKNILSWSEALRGTYDEQADYAKPDRYNGRFRGTHGRVPLLYWKDADSPWNPANRMYARLIEGDMSATPEKLWPVLPLEAFRCWIENDEAAARRLGRATVTAVRIEQAKREAELAKKPADKRTLTQPVGGHHLAFVYDFAAPQMDASDRALILDELAATTWAADNYGTFTEATATRSNWASFSYWLIQVLSIEGEAGFNPWKVDGIYRGWRNFLTYGVFSSGAFVEGEAKDQLGMDGIIALSMRREPSLVGHPHLRAYATRFLPHSVMPCQSGRNAFGDGPFLKYDLLGGVGAILPIDTLGLKYMFPDDRVIDWVYRQSVGDEYQRVPNNPGGSYWNHVLFYAIFATDFDQANDDPSKLGLGLSYFAADRGLMIARSDWSPDATVLAMHTRGASGGHPYSDRNGIVVVGEGRPWVSVNTWREESIHQSIVTIDGAAQTTYAPGRVVDFVDNADATFMVGDAKFAWDWNVRRLENAKSDVEAGRVKLPAGTVPLNLSFNDFCFEKQPWPEFDRPLYLSPSWVRPPDRVDMYCVSPNRPVEKAFRTAGLIRGRHPYVLVVDDIAGDDKPNRYHWTLNLEADVQLVDIRLPRQADAPMAQSFDVVLAGSGSLDETGAVRAGEPVLLVRVLSYQNKMAESSAGMAYLATDVNRKGVSRRLVIPAESASPDFRVMLFAHRQGDPLPKTTWADGRQALSVEWAGQSDRVTFTPAQSGKTDVTVERTAKSVTRQLAEVARPVTPMRSNEIPPGYVASPVSAKPDRSDR